MKFKALSLAFVLFIMGSIKSYSHDVDVIPYPNKVNIQTGQYQFQSRVKIYCSESLRSKGELLQSWLTEACGVESRFTSRPGKADFIIMSNADTLKHNVESYQLTVSSKGVRLSAPSEAGAFYGIQTLKQLLNKSKGQNILPCVQIDDSPCFKWRGLMLDEARNFKGKDVVKRLLDEMSALKLNIFHWHLTNDQGWRIEIKKYPRLTEVGAYRDSTELYHFKSNIYDGKPHHGYYTQEDLKEIVAYAAARNIQIVPEITVPGHITAACAAYPWLGTSGEEVKVSPRFGAHYNAINVANPQVYQFFSDVFEELTHIFPFPVIHIGGDEVRYNQWNESPEIQSFMKQHQMQSGAEVQIYFTNRLSQILKQKGRKMIGWNEITGDRLHEFQNKEEHNDKDVSGQLAQGTIVQFWKGNQNLLKKAIDRGFDIVNSFHRCTYLDYDYKTIPLRKAYDFNPIPEGITPEQEKQVLGFGCQMWGEFIPTEDSMNKKIYPRIAAYAEIGWTKPENKDYDKFIRSLQPLLNRWASQGIEYGPIN